MCHAATWVIDGIRKAGHGRAWKCWYEDEYLCTCNNYDLLFHIRAKRAHDIYPDLSPITRCHHYEISYKYTYNCTRCDFKLVFNIFDHYCIYTVYICSLRIGRHSKSVNLQTARCPYCMRYVNIHN